MNVKGGIMIVCSCRCISTNDFETVEQLNERLMENDYVCGNCIEDLKSESSTSSLLLIEEVF